MSSGNVVVGTTPGAGNVISGNANDGILNLFGTNNNITGNDIGTDATGMAALGNGLDGILVSQSPDTTVQGNLISGNGRAGVDLSLESTNTIVVGNDIGTDAAGNPVLGNASYGVYVASSGNQIGGTGPGQGNLIAGNGKGVVVDNNQTATEPVGNQILGNSIYANAALGIDLGDDGPTPNHRTSPTLGPNDFQNYPVLTSVGGNTIAGTLDSTPNRRFTLEFFESPRAGPGSQAQGQTFLGDTTVVTDATGNVSFTATLHVAINPDLAVTATATDINTGDTSEFSVPTADLAVTKAADPTVGTAGQALTYTLTVTNVGPFQDTGVIATDAVPAGAVFDAASASQGTASLAGGTVVASLGDLAAGNSATVTIVVTPSGAGSLTNTADVTANEPDPDPSNNGATVSTTINPAPPPPQVDLAVTNSAPTTGVAGQDLAYTIAVAGAGPGNEPAAHLLDLLPTGVVLVSSSVPPAAATPDLLTFDLGDLPAHASRTIVLIVRPMAAGTLVNQAVVSGIRPDVNPSNNVASATTTVTAAPAALAVTLVAAPSTGTVGRELTYTLTVANSGPGPASGVVLTSALPADATIVAASQTQGTSSISSGVVTTALGGLAVGASATVTIVVISTAAGTLTTVARVAGNEPNPNPAGAVATLSTPVAPGPSTPIADLLVTKSAAPDPATVGVPLTYTVTVTNLGPDAEPDNGVTLVNLLPTGVVFVSSSLPPMSATPGGLTYALGALAAGASQSVTIVVVPKVPGMLFNQAVATGVGPDPDPSNNYAEVSLTAHQAPTVISLERLGYHTGPTTLVLRFSAPLDAETAVDVRNYRLFQVHRGGHRAAIRIRSAAYDPASRTVVLTSAPARSLRALPVGGQRDEPDGGVGRLRQPARRRRHGPARERLRARVRPGGAGGPDAPRGPPSPCRGPRGAGVSPSRRSIFRAPLAPSRGSENRASDSGEVVGNPGAKLRRLHAGPQGTPPLSCPLSLLVRDGYAESLLGLQQPIHVVKAFDPEFIEGRFGGNQLQGQAAIVGKVAAELSEKVRTFRPTRDGFSGAFVSDRMADRACPGHRNVDLPQGKWGRSQSGIMPTEGDAHGLTEIHNRLQDRRRQARDRARIHPIQGGAEPRS